MDIPSDFMENLDDWWYWQDCERTKEEERLEL